MHALFRRGRSRPVILFLAMATALAVLAVPATASPPDRGSDSFLTIECALDDLFIGVGATTFDEGAFLDFFIETPTGAVFGSSDDVTVDGTSVAGSVELFDGDTGEPAGSATIDATLSPSGPAETWGDRFRDGNRLVRYEDSVTPATATGSLVLAGTIDLELDLSGCEARIIESSYFATNPATFVDRFDERYLECSVAVPDGYGAVYASSFDGEGPYADVLVEQFDAWIAGGFSDDVVFDDTTFAATIELFDFETGEFVGIASVDAALTSLGTSYDQTRSPRQDVKVETEDFAVEGTLTLGSDTYELTDCGAQHVEGRVRFTDPPRRARPVANDLPGDAVLLGVPDSDSLDTAGTAEAPEAPCLAVFEEEGELIEFELPIAHTAWWSFEGTGGPVTIDTAGSSIDTIVGVYDTDLTQLACVDDVFVEPDGDSLQAAVTVDTEAGVTYLVQVGGFGGDRGPVTVTTE